MPFVKRSTMERALKTEYTARKQDRLSDEVYKEHKERLYEQIVKEKDAIQKQRDALLRVHGYKGMRFCTGHGGDMDGAAISSSTDKGERVWRILLYRDDEWVVPEPLEIWEHELGEAALKLIMMYLKRVQYDECDSFQMVLEEQIRAKTLHDMLIKDLNREKEVMKGGGN